MFPIRRGRLATITAIALSAGCALGLAAFLFPITAWPEMVTPAFFLSRGLVLYDQVILPYTPLLLLALAAMGRAIGFSSLLFRILVASSLVATGALLAVAMLRRRRSLWTSLLVLLLGVPLAAAWTVYFEGPALWPDPFVAPLALAAGLALEEHERRGKPAALRRAALLLGVAILVKQTAAWLLLGALAWSLLSRRRSLAGPASLLAWGAAPYAVFVLAWGLVHRTFAHVRWTLLYPLSGHAAEIGSFPAVSDLIEALAPYLVLPAAFLVSLACRRPVRLSPLAFLAVGAAGMAWPRWGLLHLSGAVGLLVLLALRSFRALPAAARRLRSRAPTRATALPLLAGCGLLAVHVGVALLGARMLVEGGRRGLVRFWNDPDTLDASNLVSARIGPGQEFFNYSAARETVYARLGALPPGRLYVNPHFWFFLNKDDLDGRVVRALRSAGDAPILFSEPRGEDLTRAIRTRLYRFLTTDTEDIERLPGGFSWRRVRPDARQSAQQ